MDFAEYPSIGHALHPARNQTFTAHYGTKHVPFRYLFDENSPLISSPDDSALARYRLRGGVGRVGEYSRNATEGAFCAKKRAFWAASSPNHFQAEMVFGPAATGSWRTEFVSHFGGVRRGEVHMATPGSTTRLSALSAPIMAILGVAWPEHFRVPMFWRVSSAT
jgi:hypothetical protein